MRVTRWPVSAEMKTNGTKARYGAVSAHSFSNLAAVLSSFSSRSHLLTTTISPRPASQASAAILRSWPLKPLVASRTRMQTSERSIARRVRSDE